MTPSRFKKLLKEHTGLLLLFPLGLALLVFVFSSGMRRQYTSKTVVYTGLVSGYTLETAEGSRVDYLAINNAFDNLINTVRSRVTVEEVGVRLLAQHLLMEKANPKVASEETLNELHAAIPAATRAKLTDKKSFPKTVQNIYQAYNKGEKPVVELLTSKDGYYSELGISSRLKAERVGTSDMVEISYTAYDPAVAQYTLKILTSIFLGRYRKIKAEETGSVVAYFEEELKKALQRLRAGEDRLKDFSTKNKIINYYEQTKYISAQQRDIDLEIQQEYSDLAASQAAFKKLDDKLSIRKEITLKSAQINKDRDKISELSSKLTTLEINPGADMQKLSDLRREISMLEDKLKQDISSLYDSNNSKEGIPSKALFEDWVDALVAVDKGKARIKVMDEIKRGYQKFYEQFAPLGSGLNRLEREVSVAEREYLEILHSLNMSKLRERNLEFSSKLRIMDSPVFPLKSNPSKRIILVIGSLLAGFILCGSYIVTKEYFDVTIRDPERAEKLIGLPFAGALPVADERHASVRHTQIERKLLNHCIGKLKMLSHAHTGEKPFIIVLFSIQDDEGKTYFGSRLADKLNRTGSATLLCEPANKLKQAEGTALQYKVPANFSSVTSIHELTSRSLSNYDYVLVEIPSVINHALPVELIRQANLSLLLVSADRAWEEADAYSLSRYREIAAHPVQMLLNRVKISYLEGIIGKIRRHK
jgi:polysaccharide biosynthesis transport protein